MQYFERIKAAFSDAVGRDIADSLTPESTMENVDGWDSTSFIALVLSVENEFNITMTTLDAASLTSVRAIDQYLQRRLGS